MTNKKALERFKENYLIYTDGGILINYIGKNETDIDDFLQQELERAEKEGYERAVEEVLRNRKHTFQPVGGMSNIEYIAVHDIAKLNTKIDRGDTD